MRDSVALSYVHIVMWHKYRGTDHTHSSCACKIAADMCMTKILLYNWDRRCSVECRKVAGVRSVTDKFWYIDHLHCSIFQSLMGMFLSLSGCTAPTDVKWEVLPKPCAWAHRSALISIFVAFSQTPAYSVRPRIRGLCIGWCVICLFTLFLTKLYCLVTGEQGCEQLA